MMMIDSHFILNTKTSRLLEEEDCQHTFETKHLAASHLSCETQRKCTSHKLCETNKRYTSH